MTISEATVIIIIIIMIIVSPRYLVLSTRLNLIVTVFNTPLKTHWKNVVQ